MANAHEQVKKVMILIMNYKQDDLTIRCLDSLKKIDYENFEIVLINNESQNNFLVNWNHNNPPLKIIESKENLGCAGGRNLGIDYFLKNSDAEYLFFLDNDTVVDSNILRELTRVAEIDSEIGLVSMKVYYWDEPNKFWIAGGGKLSWRIGEFYDTGRNEFDYGQYDGKDRNMDSLPGGFTFIKRKTIELIGKLDERYFIYYEDPDWCLRIKKFGLKIAFAPKAKVWHKASSSLGMGSPYFYYYRTRNRLLFMYKNATKLKFYLFMLYFLYDFTYNTLLALYLSKRKKHLYASVTGIRDFLTGRFGKKLNL